jgi:WbqC-like protein family
MKVAIMQPYFLPYIGYFQLIAAVDLFVVYDNIKYTKKGWINRNRMLVNGKDEIFSVPLKSDSDSLDVCARTIAADFNREKLLNKIISAYRRAPHFEETISLVQDIVNHKEYNLFHYLHHAIAKTCAHLQIETDIKVSSEIMIDHSLPSQDKVLALCRAVDAKTYVNPIGGTDLYSEDAFKLQNIDLKFIRAKPFEYVQFDAPFIPWLSIIDVMMFCPKAAITEQYLQNYELV